MHQKGVYTYPFPNFIGVAPLSNIGVTGPNSLGAGMSHRAMWWPCGWLGAWTSYDLPTLRLPGCSLHEQYVSME